MRNDRRAAGRIARVTTGKTFDDYLSDDILRWAVERQFAIIGEAFAVLRHIESALADSIPDLPRIIAFRNVLIHGYAGLDDRLVWGAVERDLEVLRPAPPVFAYGQNPRARSGLPPAPTRCANTKGDEQKLTSHLIEVMTARSVMAGDPRLAFEQQRKSWMAGRSLSSGLARGRAMTGWARPYPT